MTELPASLRPALTRLSRRLAAGLFLDVWPAWAAAALLVAGCVALVCRLLVPGAAGFLPWLWLAPVVAAVPALIVCARRAFQPAQVVALADSLSGGHGLLISMSERGDAAWSQSPLLERLATLQMPRLRPWRRLALLAPALAFLAGALLLPQRIPAPDTRGVLADHIVNDLAATVVALKKQELLTPEEEKTLAEEIEQIRQGASARVDSSSWEAADALKERLAASVGEKQDAMKWAESSLARYAAAAQAGANDPAAGATAASEGAEFMKALHQLADSGLLGGAPSELTALASGQRSLPTDAASLRKLQASLAKMLGDRRGRIGELAALGKEFGRFDLAEFPLEFNTSAPDGDGDPGNGGINRGRADADLTWGRETAPFDRFKAQPLPAGFARSPDDWAPVVVLPGAPRESAEAGAASAARQYAPGAGQEAWRRTLAPRHQGAVRKYFEK